MTSHNGTVEYRVILPHVDDRDDAPWVCHS